MDGSLQEHASHPSENSTCKSGHHYMPRERQQWNVMFFVFFSPLSVRLRWNGTAVLIKDRWGLGVWRRVDLTFSKCFFGAPLQQISQRVLRRLHQRRRRELLNLQTPSIHSDRHVWLPIATLGVQWHITKGHLKWFAHYHTVYPPFNSPI